MDKFEILCGIRAISQFAKDIGFNARGKGFYSVLLMSDRISDEDISDRFIEIMYLGESEDAPSSKDINAQVEKMLPTPKKDSDKNFKLLRSMIVSMLMGLQGYKTKTKAESDLLGGLAHILQRYNGLLYRELTYAPDESVVLQNDRWITLHPNKENPEDYRRLKVEDGETSEEAVERKFGKDKNKGEKTQSPHGEDKKEPRKESKAEADYLDWVLRDAEAVFGKESEQYKEKREEQRESVEEAINYIQSMEKGEKNYNHLKKQVEKAQDLYGEDSEFYRRAKLNLDLYKEMTGVKEEPQKAKREFVPFKTEDGTIGRDGKSVSYSKGYQTMLFDLPDLKDAEDFEKDELYEKTLESMNKPTTDETEKDLKQRYYRDVLKYVRENAGIESQEQYFKGKLKKAEEFAKKGEVAGVKKQKPMSFQEADSGSVNPKYMDRTGEEYSKLSEDKKKEALAYSVNCQTCVLAFEMRSRGYNIEARGNTKTDKDMCRRLSAETRKAYIDPETGKMPQFLGTWEETNTDRRLIKFMDKTVKKGERYNLAVQWKYGSGHVVSVMRDDNGDLMVYDPQTNKKYNKDAILSEFLMRNGKSITQYRVKTYWGDIRIQPDFYRVDNTLINPVYADAVLKGK